MRIIFWLIIVCSSILLFSGCTHDEDTKGGKTETSYQDELDRTSEKIKGTPEFEECIRPHVNMCTNSVGTRLSQAKNDIRFCDEITAEGDRSTCRYVFVLMDAIKKKNKQGCSLLSGTEKQRCEETIITMIARETHDPKYCDELFHSSGSGTKSETADQTFSQERRNSCIEDTIDYSKKYTTPVCQMISDPVRAKACELRLHNPNQ